jgi:predicted transcriptional regulator
MVAQGKKNPALRERGMALIMQGKSNATIATELGVPQSTVSSWRYSREVYKGGPKSVSREEKLTRFVSRAWDGVLMSQELGNRRIARALEDEDAMDEIVSMITASPELSAQDRTAIIAKLKAMKAENLRDIAVWFGVLYDKHALASGQSTENQEIHVVFGGSQEEKHEDWAK